MNRAKAHPHTRRLWQTNGFDSSVARAAFLLAPKSSTRNPGNDLILQTVLGG